MYFSPSFKRPSKPKPDLKWPMNFTITTHDCTEESFSFSMQQVITDVIYVPSTEEAVFQHMHLQ